MAVARVLEILGDLVRFPSVSLTSNAAISRSIEEFLARLPVRSERTCYRDEQAQEKVNLIASAGQGTGGLLYCAHTDVVPADHWEFPDAGPFELTVRDATAWGRGSCDMKGSLACFLAALETVPFERLRAPVSLICTADEEIGYRGAAHVVAHSSLYRELVAAQPLTIIGEPTNLQVVHAHKGIYVMIVTSRGRAAHSSTDAGLNANLAMIPFLSEMAQIERETRTQEQWRDNRFSPPGISWNIGINDFTYAANITPERSVCTVSFRPMPGQQPEQLVERARTKAAELGLEFHLHHGAPPVYVPADAPHIQELLAITGQEQALTVCYGTDAAMFDELHRKVICGPGNIAQAHTVDEWISLDQLERGTTFYRHLIERSCL